MSISNTHVILVDEQDNSLSEMEKMEAHRLGALHRAFSVFILNDRGEMLLQQRALDKYHCGGLWSNACCSHPFPGEDIGVAAHRRLVEEMGFDTSLQPLFHLRYKAEVGNGLIENEYDHVFIGTYNGAIAPDTSEVSSYKFVALPALQEAISANPQHYTPWLRLAMDEFLKHVSVIA